MQGDIVAVYHETGAKLVSYIYDAWGNFTTTYHNGATANTLKNPFTYRSYYYDNDLGLYYLNARYYDSVTCRFINADGQLNTGSMLGYNLFAYCENNPVMFVDPNGDFLGIAIAFSVAVIGGCFIFGMAIAPLIEPIVDAWSNTRQKTKEQTEAVKTIVGALINSGSEAKEEEKVDTVPPFGNERTYYHITTPEAAESIMASGIMYGSNWEAGYVYAWKYKPNKYAIMNSGAHQGVLLSFKSSALFIPDSGIYDPNVLKFGPVKACGPILVWDVKIVE